MLEHPGELGGGAGGACAGFDEPCADSVEYAWRTRDELDFDLAPCIGRGPAALLARPPRGDEVVCHLGQDVAGRIRQPSHGALGFQPCDGPQRHVAGNVRYQRREGWRHGFAARPERLVQLTPCPFRPGDLEVPSGVRAAGPAAKRDLMVHQPEVSRVEVGRREMLDVRAGHRGDAVQVGQARHGEIRVGLVLPLGLEMLFHRAAWDCAAWDRTAWDRAAWAGETRVSASRSTAANGAAVSWLSQNSVATRVALATAPARTSGNKSCSASVPVRSAIASASGRSIAVIVLRNSPRRPGADVIMPIAHLSGSAPPAYSCTIAWMIASASGSSAGRPWSTAPTRRPRSATTAQIASSLLEK